LPILTKPPHLFENDGQNRTTLGATARIQRLFRGTPIKN
jgi:hypothetical protein